MSAQLQTGRSFEQTCRRMAARAGVAVRANPLVGLTPWGTGHRPDGVLTFAPGSVGRRRFGNKGILLECKVQHTSGSAERKLFSEFETLRFTLEQHPGTYAAAWLVVGGRGWTPKLIAYLQHFNSRRIHGPAGPRIQVLTRDEYRAKLRELAA